MFQGYLPINLTNRLLVSYSLPKQFNKEKVIKVYI